MKITAFGARERKRFVRNDIGRGWGKKGSYINIYLKFMIQKTILAWDFP